MHRRLPIVLILLLICSIVISPGLATAGSRPLQQHPARSPRTGRVPQEIASQFPMTVDKFITRSGGRVPRAVEGQADAQVTVIVQMQQPSLAETYAARGTMEAVDQQSYGAQLLEAQSTLKPRLTALGVRVISQYTKVYNGFLARVPAKNLDQVRALPGVRAIRPAPVDRPELAVSVPLIGAPQVWEKLGYHGEGITIAVIDTGVDYTHAALGGSGDPNDYANNDHQVIEPGTFPTAKVIGGWDFAGPNYDASSPVYTNTIPVPDPDPIDGSGHGTHVASTAAGIGVTGTVGMGVAPAASIYALKVFGEPAGTTNLTVDAIEWAMDPNGDGNMDDHVDVINMSLGSSFGPGNIDDPDIAASNNAAAVGVIVVASAGNSGDSSYITGSPAAADAAISVAASTTGYATGPTVGVSGTTVPTLTAMIYQPPVFDNDTGHFTTAVTAPLGYAGSLTATDTLCSIGGITPGALQGKVALIQRGTCNFSLKVENAAALGAVGAIVFNHTTGGNERLTMSGTPVSIPAGFIAHDDGMNLRTADGQVVVVSAEGAVSTVPDPYTPADSIASFSSRGPRGTDSMLKPDVTAPGVGIYAAAMGTGTGGVSYSGTSMAAPHVAGAAALLRQSHPDWTVEQIKAALMNNAVDLVDGSPIARQGAGRIATYPAAAATAVAVGDPRLVSLNWGVVPVAGNNYSDTSSITVYNTDNGAKNYDVGWYFYQSFTQGVSLDLPAHVVVPGTDAITVPVTLNVDGTQLSNDYGTLEEYAGYVVFTNSAVPTETMRVPFYLVPRPYTQLAVVDSSSVITPSGIAWFDLQQTGPISSSLWVYPAYVSDTNEITQSDSADIRMVGMDYGWNDPDFGDMVIPAIDVYGAWHTPQPYFNEFDLYLDTNEDGTTDFIDWNWNLGWFNGGEDTNEWMAVQYDLATGMIYLASPYYIYTDFNTGFMEWYLPATWNGLEDIAPGANTDFNFQVFGYDWYLHTDETTPGYFDMARSPFIWGNDGSYPANPGPSRPETVYLVGVNDLGGYLRSRPLGAMLVDYQGHPGAGQTYLLPVSVLLPAQVFLPVVYKNSH